MIQTDSSALQTQGTAHEKYSTAPAVPLLSLGASEEDVRQTEGRVRGGL